MKPNMFSERGQALIIITLAAIGLFAIAGLAIDGSAKFSDRRHAQNAADTAAMAASLAQVDAIVYAEEHGQSTDMGICPPPSGTPSSAICDALQLAGLNRSSSNGYNNNLTSNTVEIYSPPISGYYSTVPNKDQYVQVIITSHVPTTFMRVLGIYQTTNVVEAVAYGKPKFDLTEGAMIISYDPDPNCSTGGTGGYSVQVSGSSTVNLYGGGIFLNSDEVCGFKIPNCADLNITDGAGINSVGLVDNIDADGCTFIPPLSENLEEEPVAIPEDVNELWPGAPLECGINPPPIPTYLGQAFGVDGKWHDEWMIYPGFYTDFPQTVLVTNKSHIYMHEGVYCIDPPMNQDLSWSPVDAAMLNGSTDPGENKYYGSATDGGVTLYIKAGGGFTINANSPTYLDATNDPNSDYQGYLIVLEGTHTSHPSCTINGGADIDINGLIFAPYCNFVINGQAGENADINAQLVGWDIRVNGDNTINFNYDPSNQVVIKAKIGLMK